MVRPEGPPGHVHAEHLIGQAEKARRHLVQEAQDCYRAKPPWRSLVGVYDALDGLSAVVRQIRDEIGDEIVTGMGREGVREEVVAPVGRVIRRRKSGRTVWDPETAGRDVAERLAARISDDRSALVDDDGVALPTREVAARAVARAVEEMRRLCGMTASRSWAVLPLKALGLDPYDYKTEEQAGFSLQIERGVGVDGAPPREGHDPDTEPGDAS